uniref:Toll-like receptor 3-like n=1 Tax=Saccoglossus kowalevskii TaxID=10224 RepID=A0ABM0MZ92_SACKO|nr:PREDICTED: toll-like receptor 3-like [Saccoglossus kowalevskii]
MQPDAFEGLDKLVALYLGYNFVPGLTTYLQRQWLRSLTALVTIDLRNCNLETLPETAFSNNRKLVNIMLNNNELTAIQDSTFNNMPDLKRVFLHYNGLIKLPDNMFNGSTNITDLSFAYNKLTSISPDVGLHKLFSLKKLHLYGNLFDCGCDLVWFRRWIDTVTDVIHDIGNVNCSNGQNIQQFDTDKLQCAFPVLPVTVASTITFLILSVAIIFMVLNRWRIRYGIFLCKLRIGGYQPINVDELDYQFDAFISHSSKDEDWVYDTIQAKLENPPYNYKLCLDFRDFMVGDHISDNIFRSIERSRKTVFIVTNSFVESEWCYFELEMVLF